jgi:hypothetical protein
MMMMMMMIFIIITISTSSLKHGNIQYGEENGFCYLIQGAAEITPTFQRGITNKWYEISPKTFYFPNVDITKCFYIRF